MKTSNRQESVSPRTLGSIGFLTLLTLLTLYIKYRVENEKQPCPWRATILFFSLIPWRSVNSVRSVR
jgi:hypothetical protein